jgi:tripartite-type tricarboxylate transporter receptor subunit TctC
MFGKNLKKTVISTLRLFIILILVFSFQELFGQEKEYPEKTIKLIVGTQPGGTSDLGTRAWSDDFAKRLRVPVVIYNVPGGGGIAAVVDLSKAKPDGYILASVTHSPMVLAPTISSNIPYDTTKDVIAIGTFGVSPLLIVVNSNSPFKTIEELLDYAKKNPGKLNCGSAGTATFGHVTLELVKFYGKVNMVHVPFKASTPAVTALLGNHVDSLFMGLPPVQGQLKAGRFRGLATTHKIKEFPDVPLFSEKGLAEAEMANWLGVFAPAKIPKRIHQKLVETFEEVMKDRDVNQRLEKAGFIPFSLGPDEITKRIKEDLRKLSEVNKVAGIRAE